MRPTAILETALYVRDVNEAVDFYRDILGLELIRVASDRNAFFRCGAGVLLLFKAAETLKPASSAALPVPTHGTTGPGHTCFAATRDEIAAWRERLVAHGIEIEAEFDWPNGARSIYFRDPSGNSLEFGEPRLWE